MLEKDATWVAIGFVMFLLLLVYFKVPGQITKILDSRAQKINDELEEAKKLREEAQTVLAEFQKKKCEMMIKRLESESYSFNFMNYVNFQKHALATICSKTGMR